MWIVGIVGMLETTAFRFSTFQHFNDFNDSQEGNAVQDSPSSMTLRTSSDSLNVGTINITIFLLVHLIGELHKVYIMTMLILVKSTNLTTINKKMCNTSLTNQQRTLPNNIKDPHSGTFLCAMRINFSISSSQYPHKAPLSHLSAVLSHEDDVGIFRRSLSAPP